MASSRTRREGEQPQLPYPQRHTPRHSLSQVLPLCHSTNQHPKGGWKCSTGIARARSTCAATVAAGMPPRICSPQRTALMDPRKYGGSGPAIFSSVMSATLNMERKGTLMQSKICVRCTAQDGWIVLYRKDGTGAFALDLDLHAEHPKHWTVPHRVVISTTGLCKNCTRARARDARPVTHRPS